MSLWPRRSLIAWPVPRSQILTLLSSPETYQNMKYMCLLGIMLLFTFVFYFVLPWQDIYNKVLNIMLIIIKCPADCHRQSCFISCFNLCADTCQCHNKRLSRIFSCCHSLHLPTHIFPVSVSTFMIYAVI